MVGFSRDGDRKGEGTETEKHTDRIGKRKREGEHTNILKYYILVTVQ